MISRVKWLKEYEKLKGCCDYKINNNKYCDLNCDDCIYDSPYGSSDLLYEAKLIFDSQIITEEGIADDGK